MFPLTPLDAGIKIPGEGGPPWIAVIARDRRDRRHRKGKELAELSDHPTCPGLPWINRSRITRSPDKDIGRCPHPIRPKKWGHMGISPGDEWGRMGMNGTPPGGYQNRRDPRLAGTGRT